MTWLATRLRDVGYTADTLRRLVHVASPDDVGLLNHAAALERIARDLSPAATVIRLFFLEAEQPWHRVATVFSRRYGDDLVARGVLRRRTVHGRHHVRAAVRLDVVGDRYFVSDRRFRAADGSALRLPKGDPVYPPSSDSLLLRDAVVAADARRVLDLCAGSGVQALQHAPRAERVVAVDINPRAAALVRYNAQLNAVSNVEVRVGDLYAPVCGEQFDLIVANPPFVASPHASGPSYHAGGPTGDRILRRIIDGWGRHLHRGGRAFAVSHLGVRVGERPEDVAARWFRDFGGRALVLVLETGSPVDLAAAQSLFALDRGLSAYAVEVRRWTDYLRRHRIQTVALLLIVAQRGGRRRVEVVPAQSRVLPIPLSPPPAQRIAEWLTHPPP